MIILPPFQALVKDFKYRLPLQKADRMVGLIPLWLTCIILLWPTRRQADGESVHWASDSPPTSIQNMGVNHCSGHLPMPEQFLNSPDVVAIVAYGPPDVPGQATWVSVRLVAGC